MTRVGMKKIKCVMERTIKKKSANIENKNGYGDAENETGDKREKELRWKWGRRSEVMEQGVDIM
jgi:hypothetical protein